MRVLTPRLTLRDYQPDDLEAFAAYQSDPRAREFYGPHESSPAAVPELLHRFLAWAAEEPRRNWQLAIAPREEPWRVVGSCGLRQEGLPVGRAEFGLELAPVVWGRGYGTEAATALLGVGFAELDLDVVRGVTVSANARVDRLVRRLGFRVVAQHAGDAWMRERGWTEVEWELDRATWLAHPRGTG